MPTRKPTPDERLATLAEGIADVDAKIENLQAVRQTLVTEVLRIRSENGTHSTAGPLQVKITRQRNLDLGSVADKYPYEQRPELYDPPKVTAKRVRANFAPVDLEPFLVDSAPSVKVV